jgi:3-phosphoshikimate 1-carboxyvinyltransferase
MNKPRKLSYSVSSLKGNISVPGDKSISHRAIMLGAIANGETTIHHFLQGDDCLSTIDCFRSLGVEIIVTKDEVRVKGKGINSLLEPTALLDAGNSGTTTRLLMGILAGRPFHSVLTGDASIQKRPMDRVSIPLKQMGAKIDGRNDGRFAPLTIRGGNLKGIKYTLPVASAQVKSAIIFAAMQANGETVIIEPTPSRDHTEQMIKAFGGSIDKKGNQLVISGEMNLKATAVIVPGDISSAAFFIVAAAIVDQSEVKLEHVGLNPTRIGILHVLEQMGADFTVSDVVERSGEKSGTIVVRSSELHGMTIEGDLIPTLIDEIPIIALLATQANGVTTIKNAEELKVKETNRIDVVVDELNKLGANIMATDDGMIIEGGTKLHGGKVSSHGDHRIGMMLAIASLLSDEPVYLDNPDAIHVSYPTFFKDLSQLIVE